jgi:Asp-tRNA(Asn)/Glu-tRNA(Gln) amidotransferase A subunit family amidase
MVRHLGFKPEQSAISLSGVAPVAPSFDSVGYLAASVDDCDLIHLVIAHGAARAPSPLRSPRGLRVATDSSLLNSVESELAAAFEHVLSILSRAGVAIERATLPAPRMRVGALYAAEFASHGVRWCGRILTSSGRGGGVGCDAIGG